MLLPKNFNSIIENTFYDKEITILDKIETVDEEGGRTKNHSSAVSTFKGNVRFTNLKQVQMEYGLNQEIDITITTSKKTKVLIDDLIRYENIIYVVTDNLPYDSHILILGKKYKS